MNISSSVTISVKSIGGMTDEQFFWFCQENETLRFERSGDGEILLMATTFTKTDFWNTDLIAELSLWNRKSKLGYTFGNNAGFKLENSAIRCPDVAFVSKERMSKVKPEDKKRFSKVCPDFVAEIISNSDSLEQTMEKMEEWIANGCLLAWMIDPKKKITTIYRANGEKEKVGFDKILSGEKILPGFKVKMKTIFDKSF